MTPLLRSLVLAALMVAALAAMYAEGVGRGLDTAVPERFRIYGIPIALSADRYGLPGYVAYEEIAARFFNDKPIDVIVSEDMPAELEKDVIADARRGVGLFFVPADDKGNATFARMAFRLFGPQARSLYRTYFLLLLLSIGAFIAAFWRQPARLWAGVCVMLASAALVAAYRPGFLLPYVTTLYDPRSYGVIAILAMLHLGFCCIDGRWSPGRLIGVIFQAAMIVFAVHMRFENVMLAASLVTWVSAHALWHRRTWAPGAVLRHSWALIVLALVFAGSFELERRLYHPRYFTTHMAHHLVWHNVGIGLVLHPELAKSFRYQGPSARRVDDGTMMVTVAAALLSEGKRDTVEQIFGAAYSNPTGDEAGIAVDVGKFFHSSGSDLARYDAEVKRFVLAQVRNHPRYTAELYLRYKPRYILAHYLWFIGLATSSPALDAGGHQSPLFGSGGDAGPAAAPRVPWLVLGLLGLGLALAPMAAPIQWASALIAGMTLLAFGLAPMFVTYAAPFLMATPLAVLFLLLFLGLAMLASTRLAGGPKVSGGIGPIGEHQL